MVILLHQKPTARMRGFPHRREEGDGGGHSCMGPEQHHLNEQPSHQSGMVASCDGGRDDGMNDGHAAEIQRAIAMAY